MGGMLMGVAAPGPFGLVLPTFPQDGAEAWPGIVEVAAGAEAAGAGALWACDHVLWFTPTIDCFVALAMAATATSGCSLGTGVLQLPLRQTAEVARLAASLDAVSGHRFILGVGAGQHEGEYIGCGADYRRRGRLLDHGIAGLREHWSRSDRRYAVLPAAPAVPIWVGGSTAAARRRAARAGDGWMPLFLPPDRLVEEFRLLRKETEAAGRDAGAVTPAAMVFVSVGQRDEALLRGCDWMSRLYGVPAERFGKHLIAGPPDECARALTRYQAAGVQHVALFVTADHPVEDFAAVVAACAGAPAR